MTASIHASERLLERVFLMKDYTYQDIQKASTLLENEFRSVQTSHLNTRIILPSFPSMIAIIREGIIITIQPKISVIDEKKRKRLFAKNGVVT